MRRRNFIQQATVGITGLAMAPGLLGCSQNKSDVAFIDRILPAAKKGGFSEPDYWIWGSSVVKGEDRKYHILLRK